MAVVRNIDENNYAFDAGGKPLTPAQVAVGKAARIYPIDKYAIPPGFFASPRLRKYRILRVPLLGQMGLRSNWCGRTSMSMMHNWFELLKETDPQKRYISHSNARGKQELNLRFHEDDVRAFMAKPETTPRSGDGSYGHFVETIQEKFKKKYATGRLEPWSAGTSSARAARAATAKESEIQTKFRNVLESLDLNNPVFVYSGFTKGTNHLILLVGYAFIAEESGEKLWLAVADPAVSGWVAGYGKPLVRTGVDLSQRGTLDDVRPTDHIVLLRNGNWPARLAGLSLVRASFFFTPKKGNPFFKAHSGGDARAKNDKNDALVMDDFGNDGRAGGTYFYSTDTANAVTPEGAVETRPTGCVMPLEIEAIGDASIPAFHQVEAFSEDAGGAYPLGKFENFHGGVHLPTFDAKNERAVRAFAPGWIVASRMRGLIPWELAERDRERAEESSDLAHELAANTPDFVLLRHDIEVLKPPPKDPEKPDTFPIYSLYMHLARPSAGADAWKIPWMKRLFRDSFGSVTVADEVAPFVVDGVSETLALGAQFPTVVDAEEETKSGTAKVFQKTFERGFDLGVDPAPYGRTRLLGKPPIPGLNDVVAALDRGEMATFAKPHRAVVVDAGTPIGHAGAHSKLLHGFLHWELLAPAGEGLTRLKEIAKGAGLDGLLEDFKEKDPNNVLDPKEVDDLVKLFPAIDRERDAHWRSLRDLSFAGRADGPEGLGKERYHLRLDVINYLAGMKDGDARDIVLTFNGKNPEGDQATFEKRVTLTKGTKDEPGVTKIWVQAPGWATSVTVSSPELMVREGRGEVTDAELKDHMKRIAGHRLRRVLLEHSNEWNAKDMKASVSARYEDKDGKIGKLIDAMSFWGAPEVPGYGAAKLFGDMLPPATKIENVHPVLGKWMLDTLLERGVIAFRTPRCDAKAKLAAFVPIEDAPPDSLARESAMVAGHSVSALVIADEANDVTVEVNAKETSDPKNVHFSLGKGRYTGDVYVARADVMGWGDFELEVRHHFAGKDRVESPKIVGAKKLTIQKPVLSKLNGEPQKLGSGRLRWEVEFEDNLPHRLAGYVIADIQRGDGSRERDIAATPVMAERLPEGHGPRYENGYLVDGNHGAEVAPGVSWAQLSAARAAPGPLRVARRLVKALASLDARCLAAKLPDFKIEPRSLAAEGCSLRVSALASKVDGKLRSGAVNNVALLELSGKVPGLRAVAVGGAEPETIELTVDPPAPDDTPGGALVVDLDARDLYWKILEVAKPAADEQLKVFLRLRFYNGGHPLASSSVAESDPITGETRRNGAVDGKEVAALPNAHLEDLIAEREVATLALPRIGKIHARRSGAGVTFDAELHGGSDAFWTAAKPVILVKGTPLKSGVTRTPTASGPPFHVSAYYAFRDKDGWIGVEAATSKDAIFNEALVASGALRGPALSYNAEASFESASLEPTAAPGCWLLVAKTTGIPCSARIEFWLASQPSPLREAGAKLTPITTVGKGHLGCDKEGTVLLHVDARGAPAATGPLGVTLKYRGASIDVSTQIGGSP